MSDTLERVRRAVLGLSAGLLAAALMLEAPNQAFAATDKCPNPKNPTGCGTAPNCKSANQCQASGSICNCNQGIDSCPCVLS